MNSRPLTSSSTEWLLNSQFAPHIAESLWPGGCGVQTLINAEPVLPQPVG